MNAILLGDHARICTTWDTCNGEDDIVHVRGLSGRLFRHSCHYGLMYYFPGLFIQKHLQRQDTKLRSYGNHT